jgi:hypothetical protein
VYSHSAFQSPVPSVSSMLAVDDRRCYRREQACALPRKPLERQPGMRRDERGCPVDGKGSAAAIVVEKDVADILNIQLPQVEQLQTLRDKVER